MKRRRKKLQGHKIKKKEEMTEIVNARIKRNSSGGWGAICKTCSMHT